MCPSNDGLWERWVEIDPILDQVNLSMGNPLIFERSS